MKQPLGFVNTDFPLHVCKLNKSIYSLKQAPRAWFAKLSDGLLTLGFRCSSADSSLFIFRIGSDCIYLLIYVDDILVTGSSSLLISQFIASLSKYFPVKDLGLLHYFLGIEVHRTSSGLFLSQTKYITDLLKRTNMHNCKAVSTPMSSSEKLTVLDGCTYEDPQWYRSVVGSLQYLAFTRLDISFAVNRVCQFMHNPRLPHWSAVKRILRYLNNTRQLGLSFSSSSSIKLTAFSDADWAGCPDDRRSTGGFCIYLGNHLISWGSKKQPTIARSSTEAEYKSVANTTFEILWLQSLLKELGVGLSDPPTLWCDNIGATYLSMNLVLHSRTKHVELDYHFIRERVAAKALHVAFVSSKDQVADIFTKPLSTTRFTLLRSSLTLAQVPLESRGDNKVNILSSEKHEHSRALESGSAESHCNKENK
ncbi:uncharacterized mitochondrial protein AtMg00810-like [Juglans microcarpa x Juglans regia]|uniref:uncharacterized mitochondrial protein AtMg00810-like n=1 Tax=Juglans microcarpa x Juglans regia TaxID=2249226 RepID=UPI001B7F1F34|nr:uncharacterized mitochondrial protein AtMg00810-like [Juglans microcarpa x Juglans regia]